MSYKKIYQELKKKIAKDYGKKCKDTDPDCPVCQAYTALHWLEAEEGMERFNKNGK